MFITVVSFGFKYGIPADADLVFDVRFLPNPYYVEELRFHTGTEQAVQDYVMQGGTGEEFLKKLNDLLEFVIPNMNRRKNAARDRDRMHRRTPSFGDDRRRSI